ncbi:glycoside hydrolase family 2 TIM barrel-domain containing protein [Pedobacter sp. Du54]|uniref:glycoside hydrolase family 2 TIM barrel-domain containing protein n=1 Tax=Pedobacter anseongensis TaxID=3133439 RepID=UPI0030B77133
MKRILLLCCLILTLSNSLFAQVKAPKRMIPFTGMDYMRIMVDADYKTTASNTFKVTIKSITDGKLLFQAAIVPTVVLNVDVKQLAFNIKNLKPTLWTPNHPYLYQVTLQQFRGTKVISSLTERAGFRLMERRGGNLYLNGKPIFLRGIAINPPGRGIPEALEESRAFALDYVKFMKSINVNIIRIPDAEEWYDVCDELGMMVFGGNYGSKVAQGDKVEAAEQVGDEGDNGFPKDKNVGVSWYEHKKLGAIAHHPSLMVYAMTNETPFVGKRALEWEEFLSYAFGKLKKWDETRVYIANAGYGYGKTGDILDIHRYWGWYYSSPYTFLNIRDNTKIVPFAKKEPQPITFTECVGNYTGPDGRYNQTPAHKNPSSQLSWTGHERQDLQAQLADVHQSFTFRQATESFRQLRSINPDLSGVFPFTILFYNWDTITSFADMKPKPVTEQAKISYQPVLLSWECWTSNVYAGSTIRPVAHIINDDNDFKDLTNVKLVYQILDKTKAAVFKDSLNLTNIPYYATADKSLDIKIPEGLISGDYVLKGKVFANGKVVSENFFNLFISDKRFITSVPLIQSTVLLYDSKGKTKQALNKLKVPFKEISSFNDIPSNSFLLIGENAADKNVADNASQIKDYIKKGGRVISLRQDSISLININTLLDFKLTNNKVDIDNAAYPVSSLPPRNGYYINPERPEHPIFAGITRNNLKVWSDYTEWNPKKAGQPAIYPVTDGFMLADREGVGATAILGNYSSGLQSIALAEQFMGSGSIILTGLAIANRAELDPVADRIFLNMISYASTNAGHYPYQLITSPIVWGEYETEKGIVVDQSSGFLVNATPRLTGAFANEGIKVSKEGYQLAGGKGGRFNTRPGLQYVQNGRRPWGPFVQSFGGQPKLGTAPLGEGKFWCRIPEGQNNMSSVVWNPGDVPLAINIKVNGLPEVSKTIQPGEKLVVDAPVDSSAVSVSYIGDRRMVILETAFNKK